MLALVACAAVIAALTASRILGRRRPNLRPAIGLLTVGCVFLAVAILAPRQSDNPAAVEYLATVAIVAMVLAGALAARNHIRITGDIDHWLDGALVAAATPFCALELTINHLQFADRSLQILAATAIVGLGVAWLLAAFSTSRGACVVLVPAAVAPAIIAVGISRQSIVTPAEVTRGGVLEIWLAITLLTVAVTLFTGMCWWGDPGRLWGLAERYRNTLALHAGIIVVALVAGTSVANRNENQIIIYGWLSVLLALFVARGSRAYLAIVRLESSVRTRNALIRLPGRAVDVHSEEEHRSLITQVAEASASLIGASRSEIRLEGPMRACPACALIQAGLTPDETELLARLPRIENTLTAQNGLDLEPYVVHASDTGLPVAVQRAWTQSRKIEALIIPLHIDGRLIGHLELWTPGERIPLSAGVMSTASDLGSEAGLLIDQSRRFLETHSEIVEAEMLLAVSEVFSRGSGLDESLPAVARQLLNRAESSRITIALIDHEASQAHVVADVFDSPTSALSRQGRRIPLTDWVSYEELSHGAPELFASRQDAFAPGRIVELMIEHGAHSYLAIPSCSNGRITSIVQVMSSTELLAESAANRRIWGVIARQISVGIASAEALESSRRNERLESLRRQVNEAVQSVTNPRDGFRAMSEVLRVIPGVDGAAIFTQPSRDGQFEIEAEWADTPIVDSAVGRVQAPNQFPFVGGVHPESKSRHRWIGHPDLGPGEQAQMAARSIGAIALIALRSEKRLVGALALYSAKSNPFPGDVLELAEKLGPALAQNTDLIQARIRADELREEQFVKLRMLQAATSHSDTIEALTAVAEVGLGHAGAESINVTFIDALTNSMIIGADCTIPDWPGVDEPGATFPIEPGSIQERSYLTHQALMYTSDDPELGPSEYSDIAEYGVHSWITAPLRVGGKVVGLLQVLSRSATAFDYRRLRFWEEVAQQIAPVITTLQVSFDNRRLSRQQHVVSLINQAGATIATSTEAYAHLARIGLELPGVESSTLLLWHQEDGLLEIAYQAVTDAALCRHHPGERMTGFGWGEPGAEIEARATRHFFQDDPRLTEAQSGYLHDAGVGRAAFFMLQDESQVQGVLTIAARDGLPFPDETIQLGELAASTAASVIRHVVSRDDERRKELEQVAILRLARAATTSELIDDLLNVVAEIVRELCAANCAEIYAFSPDGSRKTLRAASPDPTWIIANPIGTSWPTENWPIDRILFERSEPVVLLDRLDERVSASMSRDLEGSAIESLACLPLALGGGMQGYIALFSSEPRSFISSVIRSTSAIADQATMAIEHMRTRLEEERIGQQRALLVRVGQAAGSSLELSTVLTEIARASLGVADSESCVIELLDAESNHLVVYGISRVSDWVIGDEILANHRAYGSWSIDDLLRTEGSLVIGSVDDPRVHGTMRDDMVRFQTNSILAHSLSSSGAVLGTYYLFARHTDAYRESDHWVAGEIATHIVSAMQNARLLENEHHMASERERLLEIAEAATRTLDLPTVLKEIAATTLGLAGAESCHIELLDRERAELVTEAYAAIPEWAAIGGSAIGHRSPIGEWSIDQQSIEINEPISIGSVDDPRVTDKLRVDMIEYGTQSILLIPIWLNDECAGILNIYSRKRDAFSNAQQTVAHTLATYAANAIQNARTHDRERARRRDQEALLRLNSAATASLDVHESMHRVCAALCEVVESESAVIGLYRSELNDFEILADVTLPDWDYADPPGTIYGVDAYAAFDHVLSSRDAFVIDRQSVTDDLVPYIDGESQGLETYAIVPLWLNDVCLGYMGLFDRRPGRFDDDTLGLLNSAAPLISLALSNSLTVQDQQRRASDREALVDVGRAAVADVPVAEKLDLIAQACLGLNRVDGVSIFEWAERSEHLICLADAGRTNWPYEPEPGVQLSVSVDSPFRPYLDSAEASSFSVSDPVLDPHLRDDMLRSRGRASAFFPLRVDDELLGLAAFYSLQPHPFDQETLRAGREVATQTALTIRASRLLDTTRRYAREQSALLAANRAVMNATQLSINEVLETISRETMVLIGADCCEIEGIAPDLTATVILAQILVPGWRSNPSGPGRVLPLSEWPITKRVLEDRAPLILTASNPDLTEHERDELFEDGTQTTLIAPMAINDRAVGTITYYSRKESAFTGDDARLATQFGSLAALAMDRVRTHMALEEQATIDGLTGLLNYRALVDRIDHQIAVTNRTQETFSLLMIDLDNFKSVNDAYGHLAGDTMLREMGRFLMHTLRASDLVARYGGDEFVAILPSTNAEEAAALRNRLKLAASTREVPIADGTILIPSFSVGFAAYPDQATDRQTLIDAADRSMYEAKHSAAVSAVPNVASIDQPERIRRTG